MARYPRRTHEFDDLEALTEEALLPDYIPREKIISATTRVRAQGSCFALNVTEALVKLGVDARRTEVLEAINSPLRNRMLIERAAFKTAGDNSDDDAAFEATIGANMRAKLPHEQVFILTLGVGYDWYDRETGKVALTQDPRHLDRYEQRLGTVSETAGHIRAIVDALRHMSPDLRIVLTVSPVPLKVDTTRNSAMVGDFLSKATLRLAVEEYLKAAHSGVYYWPAFEIVRWLSAHTPPVFGADDQIARHVNQSTVDLIMKLFLKHFTVTDQD